MHSPPSRGLNAFLALAVLLAVSAFAAWRLSGPAEAPLPEGPKQVVPAAEFANAEATVEYYRAAVREAPGDADAHAALGQALLQQARATGREGEFIPQAEEAIEAALRRDPDHYHALLLKSSLLNTLHRFEEARDLARRLIAENPHHAFPHGVLVDALVELGAYDEAVDASDAMLALKPSIASYTRASYLRELHGDGDGAIAAMRMAADAGPAGSAERAWALYNLGNLYLAEARADTAAFLFEGILEERPDYPWAVAGLGHAALVKGDADAAIRHLRTAYGMAPVDTFQELLVEAYTMQGDERAARRAAERVREGLIAARRMGEDVEMEKADFMLDNGGDAAEALAMAERQVRRRPGHLHANETYAWALHHNGRSVEAIPYIERAMRLGTGDAMVHHRAAQIHAAAGQPAEAERHARAALANRLRVESPLEAQQARELLATLE